MRPHGGATDPAIVPNGGFPEPPPDEPQRVVRCTHRCGTETVVRLPAFLPASVVQRVICAGCGDELTAFDPVELKEKVLEKQAAHTPAVAQAPAVGPAQAPAVAPTEAAAQAPAAPLPARAPRRRLRIPRLRLSQRTVQLASVPLIAGAVIAGLVLLSGDDSSPKPQEASPEARAALTAAAKKARVPAEARFINKGNYSLALPPGWEIVDPHGGAVFRAVSPDGGAADATLWIERDPRLSLAEFQKRSLANLRDLAGNATVHQRLPAPNGTGSIVQLRADIPTGNSSTPYLVTLRSAGPYRYYLATSVQPNASTEVRNQAALIHGTFTPEPGEGGPAGGTPGQAGAATATPPSGATAAPQGTTP